MHTACIVMHTEIETKVQINSTFVDDLVAQIMVTFSLNSMTHAQHPTHTDVLPAAFISLHNAKIAQKKKNNK